MFLCSKMKNNCSFQKFGARKSQRFEQIIIKKYSILRNLWIFPLRSFLKQGANSKLIINKQEMLPFSSSSSLIYQEYPINDIEESTNQKLCTSFEGLMKKQQIDYSTRNTEWTLEERQVAAAFNFTKNAKFNANIDHNQKQKQNSKHFVTTVWNFQEEKFQEKKNQEQKKNSEIRKALVETRNKKIKGFRQLLPYFYCVEIPCCLKQILKIAEKLDKYLIEKRSCQYTDNVKNIFKSLFQEQEMSCIWSSIKKIMFLAQEFYKIKIDPLKNLCLGFGSKKDAKLFIRKERLRKITVDYYLAHKQNCSIEQIPQAYIEPSKVAKFYLQNLSIVQKKSQKKQIKPEYISSLKRSVSLKQEELKISQNRIQTAGPNKNYDQSPCPFEFKNFCNLISQIYQKKLVSHMYKVSLIQNLRAYNKFSFQKILTMLRYIINQGLFLQVLVKSGCQILRIIQGQKEKMFQILESRLKSQ